MRGTRGQGPGRPESKASLRSHVPSRPWSLWPSCSTESPPRPRRKERKAAVTSVRLKKRVRAVSPGPLQPRHGRLELAPVSTGPWTSAHHHAGPTPPAQHHKLKETGSGIEELSLCDANAERSCSHFWLRSTFPTAEEGPGGPRRAAGRAFTAATQRHSLVTRPGGGGHALRQGLALTHAADLRPARGPRGRVRDRGLGGLASGTPGLAGSPGPLASQSALHSQGGRARRQASSQIPGDALAPGTYQHPRAVLQICSDPVETDRQEPGVARGSLLHQDWRDGDGAAAPGSRATRGGWRGPAFGLVLTQSAGRKVRPGQSQARGGSKSCGVSCCLQASRTD